MKLAQVLGASLARMSAAEIEMVGKHVHRLGGKGADAMLTFANTLRELDDGGSIVLSENGEEWLLQRVRPLGFKTYFDVGANVGEWSTCAVQHSDGAHIHCFEIVPRTFEKLKADLKPGTATLKLNAFGLSDQAGQVEVFLADNSYVSSVYTFRAMGQSGSVMCDVKRGDAYAAIEGLKSVDMVKIDVEGAERAVLEGLRGLLERQAIRVVQFEYNRGSIESHFLLADFYKFFTPLGYVLGRLTPTGVRFREYEYTHETFNGPNYVACVSTDRAVIEAISAPD